MRRIWTCASLALAALTILGGSLRWARGGDESAKKKPAVVVVRLPAKAELVIGGIQSKQTSAVREFDTPPLAPGKKFSYRLKAVWKDGDKEVIREATILVTAGETTEINLLETKLSLPPAAKIVAPERMPDMEMKTMSKPLPKKKAEAKKIVASEEMPDMKMKTMSKPEQAKKPTPKPELEKKPELKPEPEKKAAPKPERIKKPKLKPPPTAFKLNPPSVQPKIIPEAPAPKGTLALLMPETLTLQPGTTKLLPIKIIRTHCAGAVSIAFEGVPPGVELNEATVAADKQKVYVRAAASAEAEEKEYAVKVIGVSGTIRQDGALKIKIAK